MKRTLLITLLGASLLIPLAGCAPTIVAGVGVGALMASDRRTPGTYLLDEEIELNARAKMFNMKLDGVHANFTSFNRRVLLTGEATSDALRDQVATMVKALPNVREVINEMVIMPPTALSGRSNDSYITSKVKTRLFEDSQLKAMHVKVVTENGVVYLMGMLHRAEGQTAGEAAMRAGGMSKIVKVFEYLD